MGHEVLQQFLKVFLALGGLNVVFGGDRLTKLGYRPWPYRQHLSGPCSHPAEAEADAAPQAEYCCFTVQIVRHLIGC
jgi:hypothetical protein